MRFILLGNACRDGWRSGTDDPAGGKADLVGSRNPGGHRACWGETVRRRVRVRLLGREAGIRERAELIADAVAPAEHGFRVDSQRQSSAWREALLLVLDAQVHWDIAQARKFDGVVSPVVSGKPARKLWHSRRPVF